ASEYQPLSPCESVYFSLQYRAISAIPRRKTYGCSQEGSRHEGTQKERTSSYQEENQVVFKEAVQMGCGFWRDRNFCIAYCQRSLWGEAERVRCFFRIGEAILSLQ